jgi:hypothetical protein
VPFVCITRISYQCAKCAQVKQRVGLSTYEALRAMIVQHQELFNQQIHELHCLTRKQRLLEASLSRPAAYQAELQRLAAQAQVGVQWPCAAFPGGARGSLASTCCGCCGWLAPPGWHCLLGTFRGRSTGSTLVRSTPH